MGIHNIVDPNELDIDTELDEEISDLNIEDEPEEENLSEESEEGVEERDEGDFKIPEKFRNVDKEEVVRAYNELEKKLSEQGRDLGEQRRLIDQYLKAELERKTTQQPKGTVEEEEVDFDDFVENPSKAVDKLVSPKLTEYEQRLRQYELKEQLNEFQRVHPDYQEVVADDDFKSWVNSSKYRRNLYNKADSEFDFDAADEILSEWKERQEILKQQHNEAKEKVETKRKKQFKNASTETGSSAGNGPKKIYRRADLIKLRMTNPDRYSELSDEILQAYAEGRVR